MWTFRCWNWNTLGKLGQYYYCWWPDSFCHQCISSYDIGWGQFRYYWLPWVCKIIARYICIRNVSMSTQCEIHIDGLEQERHNSIANALELRLSCTNPSLYFLQWIPTTQVTVSYPAERVYTQHALWTVWRWRVRWAVWVPSDCLVPRPSPTTPYAPDCQHCCCGYDPETTPGVTHDCGIVQGRDCFP